MRSVGAPTQVASNLSRLPLRLFVPPPHSWSTTATSQSYITCSARRLSRSRMLMAPPSNQGMASMFSVELKKICVAVFFLS